MKDLIDLIKRYKPSFGSDMKGASPEKIERLEILVGGSLPGAFRDFLSTMGECMEPLKILELEANIDEMIEYAGERSPGDPPAPFILVVADQEMTYGNIYLNRSAPCRNDDCAVVRHCSGASWTEMPPKVEAPSLRDLLYPMAYREYRLPLLHYFYSFEPLENGGELPTDSLSSLRYVEEILQNFAFRRLPQTALEFGLFERGDAAVSIESIPGSNYFTLFLGANDAKAARQIREVILDKVPLRRLN